MEVDLLREMLRDRDEYISSIRGKISRMEEKMRVMRAELQVIDDRRHASVEELLEGLAALSLENQERERYLRKMETDLFIQSGESLGLYADVIRKDGAAVRTDQGFVMRMQIQLCKFMHTMGMVENQFHLQKTMTKGLIKELKHQAKEFDDNRAKAEQELVNCLIEVDNKRKTGVVGLKKEYEALKEKIHVIQERLDEIKDEEGEPDESEEEEDENEKEEMRKELQDQQDEIAAMEKIVHQQRRKIMLLNQGERMSVVNIKTYSQSVANLFAGVDKDNDEGSHDNEDESKDAAAQTTASTTKSTNGIALHTLDEEEGDSDESDSEGDADAPTTAPATKNSHVPDDTETHSKPSEEADKVDASEEKDTNNKHSSEADENHGSTTNNSKLTDDKDIESKPSADDNEVSDETDNNSESSAEADESEVDESEADESEADESDADESEADESE